MLNYHLTPKSLENKTYKIDLPTSKSICNRLLVIRALHETPFEVELISEANDSKILMQALQSDQRIIDIEDAGTCARFLTAYFAATEQDKVITGTPRMQQRPIKILVDALNELGANITYLKKSGFLPIEISPNTFTGHNITIDASVSSQYISALMMIAPLLPKGLTLALSGDVASKPYLDMTARIMERCGASIKHQPAGYAIKKGYKPVTTTQIVEPDWSAASYAYSLCALSSTSIFITNLSLNSVQGDSVCAQIMRQLGVSTVEEENGILLQPNNRKVRKLTFDFTDCPDLAQTVVVCCAGLNIEGEFTGLASLKIKETDRTAALAHELHKLGHTFECLENDTWRLMPYTHDTTDLPVIETYDDHRMAMAFAPYVFVQPLVIKHIEVVRKSFPSFWQAFESFWHSKKI